MTRRILAFLLLTAAASAPAAGPGVNDLNLKVPDTVGSDFQPFDIEKERPSGLSWFSSQRFSLSHSLSYGVYSGGEGTHSLGLMASRLTYRISRPMTLAAEVGMMMDPSQEQALSAESVYLKSLDFNYRPHENFHLRVMYQGAPPGGYPGWAVDRHRDPWAREPW